MRLRTRTRLGAGMTMEPQHFLAPRRASRSVPSASSLVVALHAPLPLPRQPFSRPLPRLGVAFSPRGCPGALRGGDGHRSCAWLPLRFHNLARRLWLALANSAASLHAGPHAPLTSFAHRPPAHFRNRSCQHSISFSRPRAAPCHWSSSGVSFAPSIGWLPGPRGLPLFSYEGSGGRGVTRVWIALGPQ